MCNIDNFDIDQMSSKFAQRYGVDNKKVFYKSKGKMHKKMKMTLQRAENLVQVKKHSGNSFGKKIFFLFRLLQLI